MATQRHPDLTRKALLEAAFQEMYRSGFQAASLDHILSKARVTKGALYHHFGSKLELGYAVVDELIRGYISDRWERSLGIAENPIDALLAVLRKGPPPFVDTRLGCPLNNLAQEMSPLDEGFRKRLESVFRTWREGIANALRRGQEKGQVRSDIDPLAAADFFIAALQGTISLAKNAQDRKVMSNCKCGLVSYVESLRTQVPN